MECNIVDKIKYYNFISYYSKILQCKLVDNFCNVLCGCNPLTWCNKGYYFIEV
jgi:hypothetical protein